MSKKIETIIVVIQQGKPGGDSIIGRVKNPNNTLGKIVFFKDLVEVELPDVGDEVEVFVINEFEKAMHCVFHEDTAQRFLTSRYKNPAPKNETPQVLSQTLGEIVHEQVEKTNKSFFNKTIYELTCVNEVNDFLSDRAFALINTLVVKDQIVYIVHRVA